MKSANRRIGKILVVTTFLTLTVIISIIILLSTASYIASVDLSDTTEPEHIIRYVGGIYGDNINYSLDGVQSLEIKDDYLYVSSLNNKQIIIFNITDKERLEFISSIQLSDEPRTMDVSKNNDVIYLSTQHSGTLTIIDVYDKQYPKILSRLEISDACIGVSLVESKSVCFVCNFADGSLVVINITNPYMPYVVDEVSSRWLTSCHDVWANETVVACVSFDQGCLSLWNCKNISDLMLLDCFRSSYLYEGVHIVNRGDLLFVSSLNNAVYIFNISNPEFIYCEMLLRFYGVTSSAFPCGKYLYVTDGKLDALVTYYISDMRYPVMVDVFPSHSLLNRPAATALWVVDDYVYVGLFDGDGVSVFKNMKG